MINLPKDYATAKAYDGSSFPKITPGGHICRTRTVIATKSKSGKDMLIVDYDINELGELDGIYKRIYDYRLRSNPNAEWPGRTYIVISNDDGTTNGRFKAFIKAIEDSNPGYSFAQSGANEATLQGKNLGFNFGEEEYEPQNSPGEIRVRVRPDYAVSVAAVHAGVVPPAKKLLQRNGPQQAHYAPLGAPMPDGDDELPF